MAKDLLFEIGTEEIPARYLPAARAAMAAVAERMFAEARVRFAKLEVLGTPRRLALLVEGLAGQQEDLVKEIIGPPARVAFSPDGKPTAAATGFAQAQQASLAELEVTRTPRGEYVVLKRRETGSPTGPLLPALLTRLVASIPFPRTMSWDGSGVRFARPIRWLVALYGGSAVKLSVGGVRAGRHTTGPFPVSAARIPLKHPARYREALRQACVLVDPQQRREALVKSVEHVVGTAAGRSGGRIRRDEALVDEILELVEFPTAVLGSFDERYLELPPEVLVTCLRHHQKFFSVEGKDGRLLPHFVGVRNGSSEHLETVREGYERVLSARLEDAEFYLRRDAGKRLEGHAARLAEVVFQERLGSLADKAARVERLAVRVGEAAGLGPGDLEAIRRAARLCKADLVTELVKEFPELQGVVGRVYAARDGEPPAVCRAVEEHYRPAAAEGVLPESAPGAAVAVADKLDTVIGSLAVGRIPTGSEDPWGLRRMAHGVVRIVIAQEWDIAFPDLVQWGLDGLSAVTRRLEPGAGVAEQAGGILRSRLEAALSEMGFLDDEIAAVMAVSADRAVDASRRARAIHALRGLADFEPIAAAFKRAGNILVQAGSHGIGVDGRAVDPARLAEPSERALHEVLEKARSEAEPFLGNQRYEEALSRMVGLRAPLDTFFDEVLVMAEDPALRDNRLTLLWNLHRLFLRVADFSRLRGRKADLGEEG